LFYVSPSELVGATVERDTQVGIVQDISLRYPGMTPHIHYEIINPDGMHIDPEKYSE
jgi:murein DD-endopeptidase MepM/ murein hydrolase activator NlpD